MKFPIYGKSVPFLRYLYFSVFDQQKKLQNLFEAIPSIVSLELSSMGK